VARRMTTSRPSLLRISRQKIEPQFRGISEVKRYKSFALYGRSGTGKTTLACTFPKPVLLVDINDEGTDSVTNYSDDDLQVWDIDNPQEIDDVYWWLKEHSKRFKTVIIDTITMLQTKKVEEVSGTLLAKGDKFAGDWGTMTKQDWGQVASWLKTRITRFRNLPMNVIFVAQERTFNVDTDDEGAVGLIDPEVGPSLSPSVKNHLNAAVGLLGNTYIRRRIIEKKDAAGKSTKQKKFDYCFGIGPSDIYARKVRKPKRIDLPEVIVDPDYEDLIAIIQGDN